MKFVMVVVLIRFIMNLFKRKDAGDVNEAKNDVMDPAAFELRDHFFMRCSDEI